MGTIKVKNTFNGGINTDSTPEIVKNDELRDAVNIDIISDGKLAKLINKKGTTEVIKYLPDTYDNDSLNILAVYEVNANYDYDCDAIFEEKNNSLLIYSYDAINGSLITIIDLINNKKHVLYPNNRDNTSLDFPPLGTVDASYTEERGSPQVFWDDNRNVLRSLNLNISCSADIDVPTLRELEVRKRYCGGQPTLKRIDNDGALIAGTYEFAFRFYNTRNGNSSDISLFCNPISIAKSDCTTINFDEQLGGEINEVVNKKIVLSIDLNSDAQYYDAIQLYVLKNIDGLPIPSSIAYQTAPSTDWYNNPTEIVYIGINETIVPIEDIVVEDANIISAKTQVIKDNRIFRGNIKYYDLKRDNGDLEFDNAQTITKEVDYKCGEGSYKEKGHFHKEVYAYGIAYHDEYMNFGYVTPFDFTSYFKDLTKETRVVTSYTVSSKRVTLNTIGLKVGDSVSYNSIQTKIIQVTNTYITLKDNINIPNGASLNILYSQRGNQTTNWAWKFPDRSDNQFTIISDNDLPQALALEIKGIKNHPSWAKGFAIVRQKRIKNITFQSPLIPTVGVLGVPTQGIGPIERDRGDDVPDLKDADYKKEFDCIMPKVLGMGMAKNIPNYQYNFVARDKLVVKNKNYYCAFYPYYQNQSKVISTDKYDITKYGTEISNYCLVYNPDYVFNKAGSPTFYEPNQGNNQLVVVDAIAYRRKKLQEEDGNLKIANTYQALKKENYFYNSDGYVINKITSVKDYFVKLQDIDTDLTNNKIIKDYLLVLEGVEQFLLNKPFSSDIFYDIDFFGYLEKLSNQQGATNAMPDAISREQAINSVSLQRSMLLNTEKKIIDFTFWIYEKYYNQNINLFPLISSSSYTKKMYTMTHLKKTLGKIVDPGAGANLQLSEKLPVANIFVDENLIAGGCYIVNNEKGLTDSRYSKVSTEWIFTGTYVALSESDILSNTPIDVEIWGGDCFISKYVIKINNTTQRITEVYDNVTGEADDYKGFGAGSNKKYDFYKNAKVGSFKENVEFLELYIESETNTNYHQEKNEYPSYKGDQIANYSNPYFYRYNGSYSVNNISKIFTSRDEETFTVNKNFYPAREVWSDQRLYQADGSGFIDTDGFSKFRVLNRKDLDEQYGGITKLVDFGGNYLHAIQERKVRVDPIGRDIVESGDNRALVLGTASVVGNGGYYLPYDNGSQHIRTVKYHNGNCFFIDAKKQQMVSFNGTAFDFPSNKITKYFKDLLYQYTLIREVDLSGYIDATQDNMEYTIVKRQHGTIPQDIMVFNPKVGFKTRINLGGDILLNGVYANQELYLLNENKVYTAYTNSQRGLWFGNYRNSSFKFIVNDYEGFVKVFNTFNFDMKGGFIVNKDLGTAYVPNEVDQFANLLVHNNDITPPPFQYKNFQYWLNRLRNDIDRSKLRGKYMEVEFTIINDLIDNREVSIMSIQTECEISYRSR